MASKNPPKLTKDDSESKLQAEICKWLRSKGCFVWKCAENATTKSGVSDIFFCYEGFYGFIEVKRTAKSPFRPGQKEFLAKMDAWSWAKAVHRDNWSEIQKELEEILR